MYNPRWRDPNGTKEYEQTIAFGVDEIRINGHYQHQSIFTAIHEELALAMGIIKAKGSATPGPSTLVAFQGNDYKKPDTWARFFKLPGSQGNFLEMRPSVNWEIRELNGGWFEKEFVNPTRTLRVYSNANTSTMVGNQVSDVLREVNFDSTKEGQQYFEPKHRQYLQVRQQEYEVMEIALDDLNGVPVKVRTRCHLCGAPFPTSQQRRLRIKKRTGVTEHPVMDFYMTLPSNGGGTEFNRTNDNTRYKVRLPNRLVLKEQDWEVALVSLSFPIRDHHKHHILSNFPRGTVVTKVIGQSHVRHQNVKRTRQQTGTC